MKIPKKVAQGMIIGGVVGALGSGVTDAVHNHLYHSLKPESSEYNPLHMVYAIGGLSSIVLLTAGLIAYNRRKEEEPFNIPNFERYFRG